jgi:hypothetical protein
MYRQNERWSDAVMKQKPNPIHKSGNRNLYCPYYEGCLDHAVESRWRYWDCCECAHKSKQESITGIQTVSDPNVYYELPANIYAELW